MNSIEIKSDVMMQLIHKAQCEGKTITEVIDELLRSVLAIGSLQIIKCHNCKNEIDYEISENKGYCDFCECIVYIDKD